MPVVNLTDEDWRTVMAVLAKGPWDVVNPLLMKIGDQLRVQAQQVPGQLAGGIPVGPIKPKGNKEIRHE